MFKVSQETVDRLHERGIYFRNPREKLQLTSEDVKDSYAFAKKYRMKPAAWWVKKLLMVIKTMLWIKAIQVYLTQRRC